MIDPGELCKYRMLNESLVLGVGWQGGTVYERGNLRMGADLVGVLDYMSSFFFFSRQNLRMCPYLKTRADVMCKR